MQSWCNWTFPTQSKLSRHKRTHSDVKNFKCHSWDKAFNKNDHLEHHLQSHKAAKPENVKSGKNTSHHLVCPVVKCNKKYVTQAAFKVHLKQFTTGSWRRSRSVARLVTASLPVSLTLWLCSHVWMISSSLYRWWRTRRNTSILCRLVELYSY